MNMKKIVLFFTAFIFFLETTTAQHEEHQMRMDGSKASRDHMHMMMDTSQVPMSHAFSLNLPMNRKPEWIRNRLVTRCFSYVWVYGTCPAVDVYVSWQCLSPLQ